MKTKVFKIVNIILLVVAAIMLIVSLVIIHIDDKEAAEEAENQAHSYEYFSISATGKTEYMSGNIYVSEITFSIQNNSIYDINLISGNMEFYSSDDIFGSGTISFNKDIAAQSSETSTIEFRGSTGVYKNLYETSYSNLGLTYQITSIVFDNSDNTSTQWTYNNAEVKWIKTASFDTSTSDTSNEISVQGIYLDQTSLTIEIGDTVNSVATVYPDNATDKPIEWTSSDVSVATVDSNGVVTAISEGKAKGDVL